MIGMMGQYQVGRLEYKMVGELDSRQQSDVSGQNPNPKKTKINRGILPFTFFLFPSFNPILHPSNLPQFQYSIFTRSHNPFPNPFLSTASLYYPLISEICVNLLPDTTVLTTNEDKGCNLLPNKTYY